MIDDSKRASGTRRPSAPKAILPVLDQWRRVFADYPDLAAVYLFGSLARGDARADSDADLGLVLRDPRDTARKRHRMLGELASRLAGDAPGRTFDLVLLEHQGPLFRHQVLQEAVLVYEADRERRVDFESDALVLAFDFAPTYELAARGRIAALRRRWENRRDGPKGH